jgi:hypothetical protein
VCHAKAPPFKTAFIRRKRIETENEQTDLLPHGPARDTLLRKIRQLDTASHLNDWLRSPGLQPPK